MDGKMRKNKGFTLVELMVVVSIMALLLSWGIPAYGTWKKKHDVESQITKLYNDLQFTRLTAYSQKVITGVCWTNNTAGTTSFTSYETVKDGDNNNTITNNYDPSATSPSGSVLSIVHSKYSINSSSQLANLSFDGRGFVNNSDPLPPTLPLTFSITSSLGANPDCVIVSYTTISVGKMTNGTCTPK
jgi:prepilin-type N-terminal cleavage/methylation domain-containing protein